MMNSISEYGRMFQHGLHGMVVTFVIKLWISAGGVKFLF